MSKNDSCEYYTTDRTFIPITMSRVLMRSIIARSLQAQAPATIPMAVSRPLTASPSRLFATTAFAHYAESTTPHSTFSDPAILESQKALEEGTSHLESGNYAAAKESYLRSISIKESSSAHFNLGVVHFHLQDIDSAIPCFEKSLQLMPESSDTHANLATAYIMSTPPRPDLAMSHYKTAVELDPKDGEIWFNFAAVLEACEQLEESLKAYTQARELGIEVSDKVTRPEMTFELRLTWRPHTPLQRADENYRSEWIADRTNHIPTNQANPPSFCFLQTSRQRSLQQESMHQNISRKSQHQKRKPKTKTAGTSRAREPIQYTMLFT